MLGLPEPAPGDRVFGDDEIEAAKSINLFLGSGLGEKAIAEITRVLGEGMARLAATSAAAFVEAFLHPGDSEDEVAERFAALAGQLTPAIDPVLRAAYKQHLADSVRRGMLSPAARESGEAGGVQEVTVCFADVVGFTRLGAQIDGARAGHAREQAGRARHRGDRAPRPAREDDRRRRDVRQPRCRGGRVGRAVAASEAVAAADLPSLRAGVASGTALQRSGDYYGHAVNLASRVTGVARPDSVLCTEEVRDAAPDRFEWSFARKHKLKGMSDPVPLYRARRRARRRRGGYEIESRSTTNTSGELGGIVGGSPASRRPGSPG